MLKLERDKLLIAAVLIVVVSIDMINTSMLAPVLPNIPNVVPFFAVLLLAMRFAYSMISASFRIVSTSL